MNLILKEVKSNVKSIFFWSLGLSVLIMGTFSKMAAIGDQNISIEELLAGFPPVLMKVFGFSDVPFDSGEGLFVLTLNYLLIGLLIHAAMLGARTMTKEEEDNTAEFLFLKPISRTSIFVKKIISNFIVLFIIDITLFFVTAASVLGFTNETNVMYLIKYFIIMYILQLFVLAIGNLLGNTVSNKAGLFSALFGLILYLFNIVIALLEEPGIFEFLSPLSILSGENIYNGDINYLYLNGLFLMIIIIFMVSCNFMKKKDIKMI